eukprot:9062431-Karenia_brevis.AAC.1
MLAYEDGRDGGVFLVHWASISQRLGRRADLDVHYGVKAVMCVGDKRDPKDYSLATIVLSSTGFRMVPA